MTSIGRAGVASRFSKVPRSRSRVIASPVMSTMVMVKITPIHNNNACARNDIMTQLGYESFHPYRKPHDDLVRAGFDVLVFVPSFDEEDGLVTCGNAVLGGSTLKTDKPINILGINP